MFTFLCLFRYLTAAGYFLFFQRRPDKGTVIVTMNIHLTTFQQQQSSVTFMSRRTNKAFKVFDVFGQGVFLLQKSPQNLNKQIHIQLKNGENSLKENKVFKYLQKSDRWRRHG
ncbi:Hypothetical predicted protein [Xyrichtys novacula]|uniref:Uncharacterized protein n=1 Tax=Xyrichtys novacula TaxID=13765 RepID=A0AAV1H8T5_XYRNO|nr:Hypothetical predicted protein [Xyrichtys novacula]